MGVKEKIRTIIESREGWEDRRGKHFGPGVTVGCFHTFRGTRHHLKFWG